MHCKFNVIKTAEMKAENKHLYLTKIKLLLHIKKNNPDLHAFKKKFACKIVLFLGRNFLEALFLLESTNIKFPDVWMAYLHSLLHENILIFRRHLIKNMVS